MFVRVSACAWVCVCLFALVRPERVLTCSLPRSRSLGGLVSTHVQPAAPRGERRVRRVDLCLRRSRKVPAAVLGVLTRSSESPSWGTRSTHTQALRPHRTLLQCRSSRDRYPCEYPCEHPVSTSARTPSTPVSTPVDPEYPCESHGSTRASSLQVPLRFAWGTRSTDTAVLGVLTLGYLGTHETVPAQQLRRDRRRRRRDERRSGRVGVHLRARRCCKDA